MQQVANNKVLVESLTAMRNSLLSSYEMRTNVTEEGILIRALRNPDTDYVVFSDYRRNTGKRRIDDALEIIDTALQELEVTDPKQASRVYLNTLKSVAKISKMASVLEYSRLPEKEKEKKEGLLTL
ncbi:MAG: hypothetical protein P1Q69_19880 [Candidatus Thorarchaeota archaeon]|nr:hypothetical protein [Candidatus Thorarchaeota archaeon]